jgi:hypothetical protein
MARASLLGRMDIGAIHWSRLMPLPPLRHPAWLMVATIACLGAALTTRMAGSVTLSTTFLVLAVVFAFVVATRFRRMRGK